MLCWRASLLLMVISKLENFYTYALQTRVFPGNTSLKVSTFFITICENCMGRIDFLLFAERLWSNKTTMRKRHEYQLNFSVKRFNRQIKSRCMRAEIRLFQRNLSKQNLCSELHTYWRFQLWFIAPNVLRISRLSSIALSFPERFSEGRTECQ